MVRVVYRVLFHGADGAGPVLLGFPQLRLPSPFAHVVMFGPATLGGLWDAAMSALPIALTILVFGLLNALFDVSRLFARASHRGPFRGVARALAIAWATLPSLADAVRSARFAQRLRGERGGLRLLSPILERTLERSTAVAAALELRGFAGRALEGSCERPVAMRDVSLGHGGRPVVRVDDLSLATGSLVLLSGQTGSGKSTLLRALAGLHSHVDGGSVAGSLLAVGHDRVAVPPRDTARTIGVVLQHPRDAFATDRVADEIGLALELRGVAPVIRDARVREVAERVGILPLLDRRLRGLSAGEATLVAIAAAIVEQPILLLVDEPLADLDGAFRVRITALLGALAHEAGMCVVVAEHRTEAFAGQADARLTLEAGRLVAGTDGRTPQISGSRSANRGPTRFDVPDRWSSADAPRVLAVRGLTVRHADAVAVRDVSLDLGAGEIVALSGPNGAGKSSLLAAIALPSRDAQIEVGGVHVERRTRAIALVPDASDDLFTCDTVAAECRRAERRAKRAGAASARLAGLLSLDPGGAEFAARLARHPRDLSVGERRCLAIALQTIDEPLVLLVDEPTRGLDAAAAALVAAALARHAAEGGAVLLATHDADFAAALADRILPMRDGCLTRASTPTRTPAHAPRTPDTRNAPTPTPAHDPRRPDTHDAPTRTPAHAPRTPDTRNT
ncbi:ATP-binding cassette domain-containing protein, partial [Microbacterium ulmi]|uniref:ATP-binding cassette domain-containing protein n=1 Tax=Microbacterium ulmi TaxID=179095 RepID=UPI0031CE30EC